MKDILSIFTQNLSKEVMTPPSVSFFIRLIIIIYIVFMWFDITIRYLSELKILKQANQPISSFNITQLSTQNQNKKTQTCHQKCLDFYHQVSLQLTPLDWLYCENDKTSNIHKKNQTYLDLVHRFNQQANDCQQYHRVMNVSNFTYGIRLSHDGCLLNYSNNSYQCYNIFIAQKRFRIIKSTITLSILSKIKKVANQYFLDVIFTPETRQKIYQFFQIFHVSKDSSLLFLLLVFLYIYFYDGFIALKNKLLSFFKVNANQNAYIDHHAKIQYGFKLIEFSQQEFQKSINSQKNSLNLNLVKTFKRIISFLWSLEHKKIKLMTTVTPGMGLSKAIQSQIQKNIIYYYQYAIYFNLKDSYQQVPGKTKQATPIVLLQSLLYAIYHENERSMKNILLTHLNGVYLYFKDWLMSILNVSVIYLIILLANTILIRIHYSQIDILLLVQMVGILYYFCEEIIQVFPILYYKLQHQILRFLKRNKKIGTKKTILINHFELIKTPNGAMKDKTIQLINYCLKIQNRLKYDIILVSHKQEFSSTVKSYFTKSPFKQMPKCPHRLPNDQVLQIIQSRVDNKYLAIAQLARLFTENVQVMMATFRTLKIDVKYQPSKKQQQIIQSKAIQNLFYDMVKHTFQAKKKLQENIKQQVVDSIFKLILSKIKSKDINLFQGKYGLFLSDFINQINITANKEQFRLFLKKLFMSIEDVYDHGDIKGAVEDQQFQKKLQLLREKGIIAGCNFSSITIGLAVYLRIHKIDRIQLSNNFQQKLSKSLQASKSGSYGKDQYKYKWIKYLSLIPIATAVIVMAPLFRNIVIN